MNSRATMLHRLETVVSYRASAKNHIAPTVSNGYVLHLHLDDDTKRDSCHLYGLLTMSYIDCFVVVASGEIGRVEGKPRSISFDGAIKVDDGMVLNTFVSGYYASSPIPDFAVPCAFKVTGRFRHSQDKLQVEAVSLSYFSESQCEIMKDLILQPHSVFVNGRVEKTSSEMRPFCVTRTVYFGGHSASVSAFLALGERYKMMGIPPDLSGKSVSVLGNSVLD